MRYIDRWFLIQGVSPLLVHNGQLANPLNKWSKAIKSVTKKRTKTDEDYEEIARLEFYGGLYVDGDGHPCIPGTNIEGLFIGGAKKQKLGMQFKAGMFSDNGNNGGNWKLLYDGPKSTDELWAMPSFRDIRKVSVNNNSVMRCRPIFHDWRLKFCVQFDPNMIDQKQIDETLQIAGFYCGLAEYTPKFGRFTIERAEEKEFKV